MTTTATTHLHEPFPPMSTSLADEVLLFAAHDPHREAHFHDAPEQPQAPSIASLDRLPASLQELLLISVDPDTFASLSVLNRHWRRKTDSVLLYSYHLAKCTATGEDQQKRRWSDYKLLELAELKRMLAREAKRNLFTTYQYRKSTIRLSAPPTVSASAVPHGEAFSYAFSSKGSKLVVSSSSRMYIMNLGITRPVVTAAFTLQRRPTAVAVSEDSRTLVVLAPEWRIQTYAIHNRSVHLIHTFLLDEPASNLALSPDETLVAAAQIHGVELFALDEVRGAASRRKVACEPVSYLRFADNAAFLLGTSPRDVEGTTTIINAPPHMHSNPDDDEDEVFTSAQTWLSQPLFPSSFGKTSQATPIPGDDSCIFAYDGPAEMYGILDSHKMKFVKSLVKADAEVIACTASAPASTSDACLVAVPLSGQGVQIVSLPYDRSFPGHQRTSIAPGLYTFDGQGDVANLHHQRWLPFSEKGIMNQWTLLRNDREATAKQRLVVVGSHDITGKRRESAIEAATDSGFLHLLDFGFDSRPTEDYDLQLDFSSEQTLPLEGTTTANDTENALARQTQSGRLSDNPRNVPLARSVTSAKRNKKRKSLEKITPEYLSDTSIDLSPEEQHLDGPYVPGEPRPQSTLVRQRTAAQSRRERPLSMPMDPRPRMRDSRGRGEIPDESDADNWVAPPPQYEEKTDQELPDELKQALMPPARGRGSVHRSVSTPNLLPERVQNVVSEEVQLPKDASNASPKDETAIPKARPRPQRVRTFVENARTSILGWPGLRRKTSGQLGSPQAKSSKGTPKPDSVSTDTPKESTDSPQSDSNVPPARPRPEGARRKSIMDRPLSIYTQLRPANTRSVSQPLERPRTPPSAFPPMPQPESPTVPSPRQIESLHRRQASGSISSIRSDFSTAPRAAVGAHRRGTNNMPSPWASSLMLNTVDENGMPAGSRPSSVYLNGFSPGPSRPLSFSMNGPGPSGAQTPTENQLGKQESSKENEAPARMKGASLDSNNRPASRPATSATQNKRKSFMATSPLKSIPSVGNLINAAKSGRGKSPAADLQRTGSRRLQRNGSVRKTGGDTRGKGGWKAKLGNFKKGLLKNLESV